MAISIFALLSHSYSREGGIHKRGILYPDNYSMKRGGGANGGGGYSILSRLEILCLAHSIWIFSATKDEPPFEKGIMWSK